MMSVRTRLGQLAVAIAVVAAFLLVGEAGPGESRVGHFDLAPGRYRLWCSLPQHDEWGMNAELEVRAG